MHSCKKKKITTKRNRLWNWAATITCKHSDWPLGVICSSCWLFMTYRDTLHHWWNEVASLEVMTVQQCPSSSVQSVELRTALRFLLNNPHSGAWRATQQESGKTSVVWTLLWLSWHGKPDKLDVFGLVSLFCLFFSEMLVLHQDIITSTKTRKLGKWLLESMKWFPTYN